MNKKARWIVPALLLGTAIGGMVFSRAFADGEWNRPFFGQGMMGGQGIAGAQGMMGGSGFAGTQGIMGGPGMMGGAGFYGQNQDDIKPVESLDEAKAVLTKYLDSYGDSNLELAETMEFSNQFYAEIREKNSGIFAMEWIVDKATGQISPEIGPNMMWNQKYGGMGNGMMGFRGAAVNRAAEPISADEALQQAQSYLDKEMPGLTAIEPHAFYGYYTMHTQKDGKITGMLSVNSINGAVWYHSWHGEYIGMDEMNEGGEHK